MNSSSSSPKSSIGKEPKWSDQSSDSCKEPWQRSSSCIRRDMDKSDMDDFGTGIKGGSYPSSDLQKLPPIPRKPSFRWISHNRHSRFGRSPNHPIPHRLGSDRFASKFEREPSRRRPETPPTSSNRSPLIANFSYGLAHWIELSSRSRL